MTLTYTCSLNIVSICNTNLFAVSQLNYNYYNFFNLKFDKHGSARPTVAVASQ